MHLLDALARFETQLEADGRSPHTRGNYRRHIHELHGWLVAHGFDDDIDSLVPEILAGYLIAPETRTSAHGGLRKTASLNSVRTSIRVFFAWTRDAGYARRSPAHLIRRAICAPPEPRSLNDIEARRLMDTLIVARGPVARRDHCLIALMLGCGIRIGSALGLDTDDVDIANSTLRLRRMKGDRTARVFFGPDTRDHLIGYMARKPRGPLFTGPQGARLGQRSAQARISLWLQRAGIEGRTPHSLRHSFALSLYARTHDILLVRTALHHRALASTLVYAQCSDDRLRSVMR